MLRAAKRRGSSMMMRPDRPPDCSNASGRAVDLPAPGGACTTTGRCCLSAATSSGSNVRAGSADDSEVKHEEDTDSPTMGAADAAQQQARMMALCQSRTVAPRGWTSIAGSCINSEGAARNNRNKSKDLLTSHQKWPDHLRHHAASIE